MRDFPAFILTLLYLLLTFSILSGAFYMVNDVIPELIRDHNAGVISRLEIDSPVTLVVFLFAQLVAIVQLYRNQPFAAWFIPFSVYLIVVGLVALIGFGETLAAISDIARGTLILLLTATYLWICAGSQVTAAKSRS